MLFPPIQAMPSLWDVAAKIVLTILNGESAVYIFFVLSGCVLGASLGRWRRLPFKTTSLAFVANRLLRLYPPVVVCIVFFFTVSAFLSSQGVSGFPIFTGMQAFQNATLYSTAMHGPSTTIQTEILAIPFLLAAEGVRRIFGFAGLACCVVFSAYAIDAFWLVFALPNMHAYLIAFMVGMMVSDDRARSLFADSSPASAWLAFGVFLLFRAVAHHASLTALIGMVGAGGVLVGVLYWTAEGSLQALLQHRALKFIGRQSYSLYLYNVLALYAIWAFTDAVCAPCPYPVPMGLGVGTVSVLLTLPLAWASERWVEQPAIAMGHYVSRRIRARGTRQGVGLDPSAAPAGKRLEKPIPS